MYNNTKIKGMSLFNITLSLLLSSILMTLLLQEYLTVKKHYHALQTNMDNMLELQQVADLMRRSIVQAGFAPCLNIKHLNADGLPALTSTEKPRALYINRMSNRFDVMREQLSPTRLSLTRAHPLNSDKDILIADCFHAEVQHIEALYHLSDGQIVTLRHPLKFEYTPPVYIGEWIHEVFFVHEQPHDLPSLYYQNHHTDELLARIQEMNIQLVHHVHDFLKVMLRKGDLFVELDVMVRG